VNKYCVCCGEYKASNMGRRDLPKHKDAQAVLVTTLMEFMEPFTTRGNLLVSLLHCT
jgi:hypothetical protein